MKAKHTQLGIILIILISAAFFPSSTRADGIDLVLSPVSGVGGATVTVDGTITNTGSATVFLNSENFTLGSVFFSNGDVTDFFLNAPLSLNGGASSGPIPLLTFDIAAGTPGGAYTANFLDIFGGPGSSDQTLLATTEFTVSVGPATSVPEPGALPLTAVGILILGVYGLAKNRVVRAFGSNGRAA
jgi:hypothetical protein